VHFFSFSKFREVLLLSSYKVICEFVGDGVKPREQVHAGLNNVFPLLYLLLLNLPFVCRVLFVGLSCSARPRLHRVFSLFLCFKFGVSVVHEDARALSTEFATPHIKDFEEAERVLMRVSAEGVDCPKYIPVNLVLQVFLVDPLSFGVAALDFKPKEGRCFWLKNHTLVFALPVECPQKTFN